MGNLTRRALVAGAAAAAVSHAAAAPAESEVDAALLALGREYDRLEANFNERCAALDTAWNIYEERKREPRSCMRRTIEDVTLAIPMYPHPCDMPPDYITIDGGTFYRREEIAAHPYAPPPWCADDVPRQRERIAQIAAEFKRWTAERAALSTALGIAVLEEGVAETFGAWRRTADAIIAAKPRSHRGAALRTHIVAEWRDVEDDGASALRDVARRVII